MEAGSIFEITNDVRTVKITVICAKTANNKTAFLGVYLDHGDFYVGVITEDTKEAYRFDTSYRAKDAYDLLCLVIE